ncbi:MAG: putative toxin-antitoxin system toxin component, PIN family [Candidatus Omnitrophica bacterium]|nr:putative toxin-antitoxin system toxin component, PIN family [Candidatus Omnitrophota bacterium]
MKIVLDTNVLVSGLLFPLHIPGEIARLIASGQIQLCYDGRILAEYRRVLLRPKFGFEQSYVDALLDQISTIGHRTITQPLSIHLPDRSDEPFLEVAASGGVKYLVTGNLKDFPNAHEIYRIRIISPADFLEAYRKELHQKD